MTDQDTAPTAKGRAVVASFRSELTVGEDTVDPLTWAGSVPVAHGIAPRVRVGRDRWFNLTWLLPIGFVALLGAVATAKGLRGTSAMQRFIVDYPGTITTGQARAHPGSMVVLIVAWVAATPFTLRHPRTVQRAGYALIRPAQRLFEHLDATPGEYTEADISPYFWHNGAYPDSEVCLALQAGGFAGYRLRINGLVERPVELSLADLRALPAHEQITQHVCMQGWSGIAKWRGVSLQTLMNLARPTPEAKWVVFYSLGDGPDGGVYYDAHPIEQMSHHLTMLAYDMNDEPLSFGHGAPLRLRLQREPAGLQAGEVGQRRRVRGQLQPDQRRLQPRPRVPRLPPDPVNRRPACSHP